MKYSVQKLTYQIGGAANFAWVRRYTIRVDDDASDRQIVQAAKRVAGLTGVRTRNQIISNGIRLDIQGAAQILFVTLNE